MDVPINQSSFCDHGEQMIPPARAFGSTYAAAMYRPRAGNEVRTVWRAVGMVNGTQLVVVTLPAQ